MSACQNVSAETLVPEHRSRRIAVAWCPSPRAPDGEQLSFRWTDLRASGIPLWRIAQCCLADATVFRRFDDAPMPPAAGAQNEGGRGKQPRPPALRFQLRASSRRRSWM